MDYQAVIDEFINRVAAYSGLQRDSLLDSQKMGAVDYRFTMLYIVRNNLPLSLSKIARLFGYKDHTSVIHAVRQAEYRRPVYNSLISALTIILNHIMRNYDDN